MRRAEPRAAIDVSRGFELAAGIYETMAGLVTPKPRDLATRKTAIRATRATVHFQLHRRFIFQ